MTDPTGPSAIEQQVMRAIIRRENKRIAAERREAAAKARAAAPARPGTRWSTKPAPPKPPSAIARALRDEAAAIRDDWARRHPTRAAEERALAQARSEMIARYDHKRHGTPETHDRAGRLGKSPLERLYAAGLIEAHELAAAAEIAGAAERLMRDVAPRTASLETRVDVTRHDAAFFESLAAVRREMAYRAWWSQLGARATPLLEVIVDELPLKRVAAAHRMREAALVRALRLGLELWAQEIAKAWRGVRKGDLAAAHARLDDR